jgi:hypothetical protein
MSHFILLSIGCLIAVSCLSKDARRALLILWASDVLLGIWYFLTHMHLMGLLQVLLGTVFALGMFFLYVAFEYQAAGLADLTIQGREQKKTSIRFFVMLAVCVLIAYATLRLLTNWCLRFDLLSQMAEVLSASRTAFYNSAQEAGVGQFASQDGLFAKSLIENHTVSLLLMSLIVFVNVVGIIFFARCQQKEDLSGGIPWK